MRNGNLALSDRLEGERRANQSSVLVGDIGGTNARFAIADLSDPAVPVLGNSLSLRSTDFDSLGAVIESYFARTGAQRTARVLIAVAGPVVDGAVQLTNLPWRLSEAELRSSGFREATLVNDFRALAAAAESLGDDDLAALGDVGRCDPARNIAIIGAGTGLGISALVRDGGTTAAVSSEGGHAGFAPDDELEASLLQVLTRRFGRVSAERLLSGPGLVNIYEALCELEGVPAQFTDPAAITAEAERNGGPCRRTVGVFCGVLGSVAGDVALMFGAAGGVLLTGGVVKALQPFLSQGSFRAKFESKGRLSSYVKAIPTFIITLKDAALLGCARLAAKMRPEPPATDTTPPNKGMDMVPTSDKAAHPTAQGSQATFMVPLVVFLFFAWGFTTVLNDSLIPKLKGLFSLDYAEAMLVQSAFFIGYFVFSIPSGVVLNKLGYVKTIALGLAVMAAGCVLLSTAAMTGVYANFLGALFVVAAGMALLQVAANPYIAVLGSPKNASSRLTFAQSFNSLGTFIGPFVGSLVFLQRGIETPKAADAATLRAARVAEASLVQGPYLIIAAVLVAVALVFWLLRRVPSPPTDAADLNPFSWRVIGRPRLMLGVLAIFLYVGAEVAIGSGLTNYLNEILTVSQLMSLGHHLIDGLNLFIGPFGAHVTIEKPVQVAGVLISLYWGGAMVGRFIGSGVLALVKPGKVLAFNAFAAALLALISAETTGMTAAVAVLAIGLANSIMFPTIFTLALEGLGEDTSKGSALLCTAILGGALIPYAYGWVIDLSNLAFALVLPAGCYVLIAAYGLLTARGFGLTKASTEISR